VLKTKVTMEIYGQEKSPPIKIKLRGDPRQVYKDFGRWLNALGLPTKEMKKNAHAKTAVQDTASLVCHKK